MDQGMWTWACKLVSFSLDSSKIWRYNWCFDLRCGAVRKKQVALWFSG